MPGPATVFVHVHYPEIWAEMAPLLARRLNLPFDLVLTTAGETGLPRPETPWLRRTTVLPVENRGRDILPFLHALGTAPPFQIGLKLHTKKSPQREDGDRWRAALLDSLLPDGFGGAPPGPGTGAAAIVRRMADEPRAGLIAPAGFALGVRSWVLQNRAWMDRVMEAAGAPLQDEDLDDTVFAAGSMFWFRREALLGLAAPAVQALFEPEQGQLDGTAAHAAERLFPVQARRAGFVSLAAPALEEVRPGLSDPALLALARRHADLPSAYFAPAEPSP